MRKPRSQRRSKGTGTCVRCGRKHPKGKQQREKAKKLGWKCKPIVRKATEKSESRFANPEKRKAKCQSVKLRNEERKAERIAKSKERSEAWQSLTIEQRLAELDKRPGNCAKQRAKLMAQLEDK